MRVASQLSIGTACPKAAKQWHAVSSSRIKPGHPAVVTAYVGDTIVDVYTGAVSEVLL